MSPRSDGPPARGPRPADARDPTHTREQTAAYLADLAGDLSVIARRSGLDTLAYILHMAQLEAENAADPWRDER